MDLAQDFELGPGLFRVYPDLFETVAAQEMFFLQQLRPRQTMQVCLNVTLEQVPCPLKP